MAPMTTLRTRLIGTFLDPPVSRTTGKNIVVFAAPITDDNGAVTGIPAADATDDDLISIAGSAMDHVAKSSREISGRGQRIPEVLKEQEKAMGWIGSSGEALVALGGMLQGAVEAFRLNDGKERTTLKFSEILFDRNKMEENTL